MHTSAQIEGDVSPFVHFMISLVISAAAICQCILPMVWLIRRIPPVLWLIRRIPPVLWQIPPVPWLKHHIIGDAEKADDKSEIDTNPVLFLICVLLLSLAVAYSRLVAILPSRSTQWRFQAWLLLLLLWIPRVVIGYEVLHPK